MIYNIDIKINKKVIYSCEVEARDEEQAREFAYDMMEWGTYAEATRLKKQ